MNVFSSSLSNGLPLLVVPLRGTTAVTTLLTIGAGSVFDGDRVAGLAHFLEHIMFKGTPRRPSKRVVNEELDAMGAEHNAHTSWETTTYYVKAAAQHYERAMDVVSDMLLHPLMPKEEVALERGIITEEIRMIRDNPARRISDLFFEALFAGHPLQRPISGDEESVRRIEREDLQAFWHTHYRSGSAVLAVVGAIGADDAARSAEHLFGAMPTGGATQLAPWRPRRRRPVVTVERRATDQAHLWCGFPGMTLADDRRFAAEVLATVLGGNASSRLFMELREERGLAYRVGSLNWNGLGSGVIATQAGVRRDGLEEAVEVIINQYRRLFREPVGSVELARAKEYVKGSLALELEESNAAAEFLADQHLLTGTFLTPDDFFSKIDAVTAEDIMAVSVEFLRPENLALAVVAPEADESRLQGILEGIGSP